MIVASDTKHVVPATDAPGDGKIQIAMKITSFRPK
jgi:hypothetical protein